MRVVSEASEVLSGTCLIAAPHMDDGVLGCGGTVSMLPDKTAVHFLYATDGSRSPVKPFSRAANRDLVTIRAAEARSALAVLGIPPENVHLLGLPDARLHRHADKLTRLLTETLAAVQPERVLVPFRYDRHPDHLALNRGMHRALVRAGSAASMYEYFVYTRWRLLPRHDVRRYIEDRHLLQIETGSQAARKRQALERFASQTTRFFPWQRRPILTPERVAEVSRAPELFLLFDPAFPGAEIFPRRRAWLRLVHTCEPRLKRWKDALAYLLSRRQQP